MALQHAPDATIFETTLPDKEATIVAFSFGEVLAYHALYGVPIGEEHRGAWIKWLNAEDNELGRLSNWVGIQVFRLDHPDARAVKTFKQYAIENELPY